jgi:hypothetical protein
LLCPIATGPMLWYHWCVLLHHAEGCAVMVMLMLARQAERLESVCPWCTMLAVEQGDRYWQRCDLLRSG